MNKIVGLKKLGLIIVCCFIIAVCVHYFLLGDPDNFMNNDPNNYPLPGNVLGTIYEGGITIPLIETLLFAVIVLSIERYFVFRFAFGKVSLINFVDQMKNALHAGDMKIAQELCDRQGGTVAHVLSSILKKYAELKCNCLLSENQKVSVILQELDDAIALELPHMKRNLSVIGIITVLGILTGGLGMFIGITRSFAALFSSGIASSMALSQGIAGTLINMALGILTGALAVIAYNYYSNKIDRFTYSLDEVAFFIVQTFTFYIDDPTSYKLIDIK